MFKPKIIAFDMTETREGIPDAAELRARLEGVDVMGEGEVKCLIDDLRLGGVSIARIVLQQRIREADFRQVIARSLGLREQTHTRLREELTRIFPEGNRLQCCQAAGVIGKMGDQNDIPVLLGLIERERRNTADPDFGIMQSAAAAIVEISDREGLETRLEDMVSQETIRVLKEEVLTGAFASFGTRDADLLKEVCILWGEIGNVADVDQELESQVIRTDLEMHELVQEKLSSAIVKICAREGDRDKANWVFSRETPRLTSRLRKIGARIFGKIGTANDIERLCEQLPAEIGEGTLPEIMRAEIYNAIVSILERENGRQKALEMLRDESFSVKAAGAMALERIGQAEDVETLLEIAREVEKAEDEADAWFDAANAAARISIRERDLNGAREMLRDDADGIRLVGAKTLAEIGQEGDLASLRGKLQETDEHELVRAACLEAISEICERRGEGDRLSEVLGTDGLTWAIDLFVEGEESDTRASGAKILGKIGREEHIETMFVRMDERVDDPDIDAVVEIYSREGSREEARAMLVDTNPLLKQLVGIKLLGKIGQVEDREFLLEVIRTNEVNDELCEFAADALVTIYAREGCLQELLGVLSNNYVVTALHNYLEKERDNV
ncbi:MAG: hypothetical protein HQ596_03270 [Candidatus Saganbacteria bacterium]|nr:hypothetical protein [Candidatus Saganbacteria bacterium]